MSDLIQEAKDLVAEARRREKCPERTLQVERALEDWNDAGSAGNGQTVLGAIIFGVGLVIGFGTGWTGIGLGVGAGLAGAGATAVAAAIAAKAEVLARATKQLKRAVDDLRECLNRP